MASCSTECLAVIVTLLLLSASMFLFYDFKCTIVVLNPLPVVAGLSGATEFAAADESITFLTTLANEMRSDKGTTFKDAHNYMRVYGELWASLREKPVRLLEIGLNNEGDSSIPSLEIWRRFFASNDSQIHGMDLKDLRRFTDTARGVHVWQGDQGDASTFDQIQSGTAPFDIIVDDGSHTSQHQHTTLAALWDRVKPGGWYIIEDLHYQPPFESTYCPKVKLLAHDWKQGVASAGEAGTQLTRAFVRHMLQECSSIDLFDSQSVNHGLAVTDALLVLRKRG